MYLCNLCVGVIVAFMFGCITKANLPQAMCKTTWAPQSLDNTQKASVLNTFWLNTLQPTPAAWVPQRPSRAPVMAVPVRDGDRARNDPQPVRKRQGLACNGRLGALGRN